jgi:hypothetical protein
MIHISSELHKKLKMLASLEEKPMQEVADAFLAERLQSDPRLKDRELEPA